MNKNKLDTFDTFDTSDILDEEIEFDSKSSKSNSTQSNSTQSNSTQSNSTQSNSTQSSTISEFEKDLFNLSSDIEFNLITDQKSIYNKINKNLKNIKINIKNIDFIINNYINKEKN